MLADFLMESLYTFLEEFEQILFSRFEGISEGIHVAFSKGIHKRGF